jgi:glycosyltransferase involved in cell wall biosynthesis
MYSVNLPVSALLTKMMKEFAPDIVHSHCPFFMGDFALRLSREYALPLVFTYHTMFEQYINFWPVQNEGVKRFMVKLAAGYANAVDQVIVPCESVRKILADRGVKTPMEVVPTGVDLERFSKGDRKASRERNQIPCEAFVIGHAGRLSPEKNLGFLTDCLVAALKGEERARVLIVGKGESDQAIIDAFAKEGLSGRLHMTGVLHDQELVDAYAAMDVFAFASLSETQGLVLVEAMAAGVPVVALDATGVREVVEDTHNGRLLAEMDMQSFVEALRWVMARPSDELRQLQQGARNTAGKYPVGSDAAHMLRVYETLLTQKSEKIQSNGTTAPDYLRRLEAEWDIYRNYFSSAVESVFEGDFQATEPEKIVDTTSESCSEK